MTYPWAKPVTHYQPRNKCIGIKFRLITFYTIKCWNSQFVRRPLHYESSNCYIPSPECSTATKEKIPLAAVYTDAVVEALHQSVLEDPSASTRHCSVQWRITRPSFQKILKLDLQLFPYKMLNGPNFMILRYSGVQAVCHSVYIIQSFSGHPISLLIFHCLFK